MVVGAAVIARNLGITPMVIGLTVVGFATSAPEILVAATAAIRDASTLALGNAFGSNIANIGLVVGVAAIIHPLTVKSEALRRELPAMVAVSLIPVILLIDLTLSRLDGVILLIAFLCFIYWVIKLGQAVERDTTSIEAEYATEIPDGVTQQMAILWITIGLVTSARRRKRTGLGEPRTSHGKSASVTSSSASLWSRSARACRNSRCRSSRPEKACMDWRSGILSVRTPLTCWP